MRRTVTTILKLVFLQVGIYGLLRRFFPNPCPAILRFHSVAGPEGRSYASPGISLPPEAFERMIRYLSRRYPIADMDQIAGTLETGVALPPNSLAVTFDDGYQDNLEACRSLSRFGWRATIYLTVGRLEGMPPLWLAEVRRFLLDERHVRLNLRWRGVTLDHPLRTPEERETAIMAVTSWIKSLTVADREEFLAVLAREHPPGTTSGPTPRTMLSWDEIRAMRREGMSFGGHTLTHGNLVHATAEEIRVEVRECWREMTRELGESPRHFAYPNGGAEAYYDEQAKAEVRGAGFVTAVTSRQGWIVPGVDPMALPRIGVSESLAAMVHELEWGKLGQALRAGRRPTKGASRV